MSQLKGPRSPGQQDFDRDRHSVHIVMRQRFMAAAIAHVSLRPRHPPQDEKEFNFKLSPFNVAALK